MQAHPQQRIEELAAAANRRFDLLVIGGGVTGCGIARDAALRGLSVALVEKDDFASGTSSRSSRLVHGGVRYLENGQLHLVFESSAERRRLLELAPHLVRPLEFTWPVYAGARLPRWKLGAGLLLYDALALFRNVGRHRRLNRAGILAQEPMLRADGLRGGATYFDAATDDARLTLANAVGAREAGAVVINYATVTNLIFANERVAGATVRDTLGTLAVDIHASVVVNATGPWSDDIRNFDERSGVTVRGSKGVHVAVPRERVGNIHALTLLSPRDGRVVFVLPSGPNAIIGTTDTYTDASPDQVRASAADITYLLEAANAFFPAAKLIPQDVITAWAGIRPLLPARGSTPGAASREHAITTSSRGLVTITGGKLTTYRVMAAQVVDVACEHLKRDVSGNVTETRTLPGGDFRSLPALIAEVVRACNDIELADHLVRSYGTRWSVVWREINADGGNVRIVESLPYTIGEMRYCVVAEMAQTIGDLLIRRTHVAYETRDHGLQAARQVAVAIAPLLQWGADQQRAALDDYAAEVERLFTIES